MSTHPGPLYVSYLLTDELVRSLGKITLTLMNPREHLTNSERETLRGVRQDLIDEIQRRQLRFPGL